MKPTQAPRKKFTKEEDDRLKSLVSQFGTKCWEEISRYMPGRCGRQCRDRYNNYLVENLYKGPWKFDEDKFVVNKYKEIGPHWVEMSKMLPGRSGNDVKNRWHKYLFKHYHEFQYSMVSPPAKTPECSSRSKLPENNPKEEKPTNIAEEVEHSSKPDPYFDIFDAQMSLFTFPLNAEAASGNDAFFDYLLF